MKKLLKSKGWSLKRQGKGDHEIWAHPSFDESLTLDGKGSNDIPKGTLNQILKRADLK